MKAAKDDPIYRPYTTALEWRAMPRPTMINGAMVTKYQAPVVIEYVNMETSEIIPADELKDSTDVWPPTYPAETMLLAENKSSGMLKPKPKVLTSEQTQAPLFWEVIPPPKYPGKHGKHAQGTKDEPKVAAPKKRTRPSKSAANPHNALFKDCWSIKDAKKSVSPALALALDNILTGISLLDHGGNTRPISPRLILDLLRELGEVSTATVQAYTGLSTSYCRKLAGLVGIAIVELNKITMEGLVSLPVRPSLIGERISSN